MHARFAARGRLWIVALALTCAIGGGAAACGSDESSVFTDAPDASGGDDGAGGGDDGSPNFVGDDGGSHGPLLVEPANATVTITDRNVPGTQGYTAKVTANGAPVGASWSLDDYTTGRIDKQGAFTTTGLAAGAVHVLATYGGLSGSATLAVKVNLHEDLGDVTLPDGRVIAQGASGISTQNRAALGGAPQAEPDAGTATRFVYPYEHTVMPRGLIAPVPEFTAGTYPPEDIKIMLDATNFHWEGLGHVASPSALWAGIPQDAWAGALQSAAPDPSTQQRTVTLSLIKAVGGVAYGPAVVHIVVAPASLTGVLYYSSYSQDTLSMDAGGGGNDFGLWSVHPGTTNPPSHLNTGCVICHAVSASGRTLTTGADQGGPGSGVYATTGTSATEIASTPAGLGGDSRGLSWAAISPDGDYILRSKTNFWGGDTMLAWKTPPQVDGGAPSALSTTVPVAGTNIKTFVPSFSPDGKKLVYVNADGAYGATSKSVGIMDVAIDPNAAADGGAPNGTVTLANPATIWDANAVGSNRPGYYTRVPMFLPDSTNIVLQETVGGGYSGFDGMLPNWTGTEHVYTPGALYLLRKTTSGYENVELANANTGSYAAVSTANYEPKPLPVQAGGYYWVVFTSIRSDGLNGPAIKKLWITAISPGAAAGTDPSHPPFLLTNQSIVPTQECERGYWSVEPCHPDGADCASGDDCCNGFCRPIDDQDPSSKLVCKKPAATTCSRTGDRCRAGHNEDCCNAASGVTCIGSLGGYGTCAVASPR